jgi:HSP20 family protein
MTDLIRWDPVREIASMRDSMDRVFEDFFSHSPANFEGYGSIDINMIQTDDAVIIKANIPGIKPEDINISITGETLTIRGETKEEEELKDANYHIREMKYGSFARSILLPSRVVSEKGNAEFKDGILKLTLPKAEEVKPKLITIKAK